MEMNTSSTDLPVDDAVFRGSPDYEKRRRELSWSRTVPERHPNLIVSAHAVADVEKAVKFAADRDWVVAAKSGGHSHIASSIRDDALVIDRPDRRSRPRSPLVRARGLGKDAPGAGQLRPGGAVR
jgi:hypothetical protein